MHTRLITGSHTRFSAALCDERLIYWLGKALVDSTHRPPDRATTPKLIPGAELIPSEDRICKRIFVWRRFDGLIPMFYHNLGAKTIRPHVNGMAMVPDISSELFLCPKKHAANHGSTIRLSTDSTRPNTRFFPELEDYVRGGLAKASWKVKKFSRGSVQVPPACLHRTALCSLAQRRPP